MNGQTARPATQAGAFYTGDPEALRREVENYIESAPPRTSAETPVGFVSPHAGYRFSGATAGHVYRQLRDLAPRAVVVLAPSHHASFPLASIWDGPAYATPLGHCPIDQEIVAALRARIPEIQCHTRAETQEHSLEVQIPFLQVACPNASLVPLLVGDQDRASIEALTEKLEGVFQESDWADRGEIALVASSDGYHGYYLEECRSSDARLAEAIQSMDPEALYGSTPSGHSMACGRGPIAVAMELSKGLGAQKAVILDQTTSADAITHRDGEWVVGYTAAVFE